MKKLLTMGVMVAGCAVSMSMGGVGIANAEPLPPTVVEAGYHTGYIPDGFDTNDHVQLVGEGMFRNSCYRPASTKVEVDHARKKITLHPSAYQYQGYCLQVMVPFDQAMEVGILKAGTYQVVQKYANSEASLGELKVRVATNAAADDFLYAPISQAYFESKEIGKASVKIAGEFTNSCMKLADVMVSVQPKVIVLQPISEVQDRSDCVQGRFPFEKQVEISDLKTGRYLLHVRSLNGKSVNTLIDAR